MIVFCRRCEGQGTIREDVGVCECPECEGEGIKLPDGPLPITHPLAAGYRVPAAVAISNEPYFPNQV